MSVKKFAEMLRAGDFVVLDTETTGLNEDAEVCQIALANSEGHVLLDTYVKPVRPIPAQATSIHCISDEMVELAPSWSEVLPKVLSIVHGKNVVIYNRDYDRRVMMQSAYIAGLSLPDWKSALGWHCAMENFAVIYGDWNSYHQSYRWQKLETAARHYGITVVNAHNALGDVLMTLEVCRKIAATE